MREREVIYEGERDIMRERERYEGERGVINEGERGNI